MLDKNSSTATPFHPRYRIFFWVLTIFNLLSLTYILTVGYLNRLALDDYAFVGVMNDHGFLSPFTFWYSQWQGRFGPQLLINAVLVIYKMIPNLLFYTAILTGLFIYAIYELLKFFFPVAKSILLNFSTLLFITLLLTTFELNTFYWLNVSTMYFGGILFALLGIVSISKKNNALYHFFVIAFCFLYVGSSAEHVGALACGIVALVLLRNFATSGYNLKIFLSQVTNKKILTAFLFCVLAFSIMVLAPGNKIRMQQFQQVTDPLSVLRISYNSSWQLIYYIFFKLPYILVSVTPFMMLGVYLKGVIELKKVSLIYLLWPIAVLVLIFISTLPASYAMGIAGPLRSFVFINSILVIGIFLTAVYIGYYYPNKKLTLFSSVTSLLIFAAFVLYSFKSELPALRKFNHTDRERVSMLLNYKAQNRKESVVLQPLYHQKYVTISDMFCILTRIRSFPSENSNLPLFIGDIGEAASDWRNNHLKHGLGLDFPIALSPNLILSKAEIDRIKSDADKSYETQKFKFYLKGNYAYFQIDTVQNGKIPPYIFLRVVPANDAVLKTRSERILIHDFIIADHVVKYGGDYPELQNQVFIRKEITKFPIRRIETGFYDVVNGAVEYSQTREIKFF